MRILTKEDNKRPVLFLNVIHNIEDLEELETTDKFIEKFNATYADVAEDTVFLDIPMIRVKAFYDADLFDDDEIREAEAEIELSDTESKKHLLNVTENFWNQAFELTEDEKEKLLAEYKQRIKYMEE